MLSIVLYTRTLSRSPIAIQWPSVFIVKYCALSAIIAALLLIIKTEKSHYVIQTTAVRSSD